MKLPSLLSSLFFVACFTTRALAVPNQITYQGTLREGGSPVNGPKTIAISLTDKDGKVPYTETNSQIVDVKLGLFTVEFTPKLLPGYRWEDITPHMRITINGQELKGPPSQPFEPVTANLYSMVSGTVADGAITKNKLATSVGTVPPGTIVAFGGNADPTGWLVCDGREVSRATYADLFAAIGTSFGSGNGTSTFNIPDFRDDSSADKTEAPAETPTAPPAPPWPAAAPLAMRLAPFNLTTLKATPTLKTLMPTTLPIPDTSTAVYELRVDYTGAVLTLRLLATKRPLILQQQEYPLMRRLQQIKRQVEMKRDLRMPM